jgi:hypothetical protein
MASTKPVWRFEEIVLLKAIVAQQEGCARNWRAVADTLSRSTGIKRSARAVECKYYSTTGQRTVTKVVEPVAEPTEASFELPGSSDEPFYFDERWDED